MNITHEIYTMTKYMNKFPEVINNKFLDLAKVFL